jgi:hypothetical protein
MIEWKRRLLGLGVPCLLAFLLDTTLTLCGQPREYWAGQYTWTTEDTLFFHTLYVIHPVAALGGYVAWAVVMATLLLLLPELLAVILAIALVFGHTGGAYTWLIPVLGPEWYRVAIIMFLVAAVALGTGLYWGVRASAHADQTVGVQRVSMWLRCGLSAALAAAAGSMILIPWQR